MALRGVKKHSPQARQDNNVEALIALDIMRTNVITGSPGMSIKDATNSMLENDIGALPVVDEERHVVGMITRRDIVAAI
jgi:CBS domain-containing protein